MPLRFSRHVGKICEILCKQSVALQSCSKNSKMFSTNRNDKIVS